MKVVGNVTRGQLTISRRLTQSSNKLLDVHQQTNG